MLGCRSVNEVIVERPTLRPEGDGITIPLAEIEPGAPRVIEENSVALASVHRQEKRNRLVERVHRFLRADIRVPERVRLFAPVELSGFVAEAKVMFGWRHLLADRKPAQLKLHGTPRSIGRNDISRKVANHDP